MCDGNDGGLLGLHDECCNDDPDNCSLATVEGDMLRDACADVISLVTNIRELVDEAEGSAEELSERSLANACNTLTIGVGELVRAVVVFAEPDAGMEPLE